MTVIEYVVIGYFIGILTTAPIGPVNVMAIQHAIRNGFRHGVFVGVGAVVADTIYAIIAIFGVTAVTKFIEGQFDLIEIIGGALLILFGLRIWTSHSHLGSEPDGPEQSYLADSTAAFFLAITNPGAVLAFIAIFGALGDYRPAHGDYFGAMMMVGGVAAGATSWWFFVSAMVTRFKSRIDDAWLDRANHIAGFLLVLFGGLIYLKLAAETLL